MCLYSYQVLSTLIWIFVAWHWKYTVHITKKVEVRAHWSQRRVFFPTLAYTLSNLCAPDTTFLTILRGDTQTHLPWTDVTSLSRFMSKRLQGAGMWREVANSSIQAKHHGCQCFVRMTEQLLFTWSWCRWELAWQREARTWQSPRGTTSRSLWCTCCCSKGIKLIEGSLKPSVLGAFISVWIITSSSDLRVNVLPIPVKLKWFLNSSQKVHIWEVKLFRSVNR